MTASMGCRTAPRARWSRTSDWPPGQAAACRYAGRPTGARRAARRVCGPATCRLAQSAAVPNKGWTDVRRVYMRKPPSGGWL
eukprot:3159089-Prymnesium_polylepis.1